MKRVFALALVLFMLLPLSVFATTNKVITKITVYNYEYPPLLELGTPVPEMLDLYPTVSCALNDASNIEAPVTWDVNAVDFTKPGWVDIPGVVTLPDGYTYPNGDLSVYRKVYLYDPLLSNVEPVSNVLTFTQYCNIVPLGTSESAQAAFYAKYHIDDTGMSALKTLLKARENPDGTFYLKDSFGTSFSFSYPLNYDVSLVDINKTGSYPIFSTIPSYFIYNAPAEQNRNIHVLDPNTVDLRAWWIDGGGTIHIPWFLQIESPQLWVRVDDEKDWVSADSLIERDLLTNPEWGVYSFAPNYATGNYDTLQIMEQNLVADHRYEFEVRYENDGCSVNSFVLDLRKGYTMRYGSSGGSRGGADREEITPHEIVPPIQIDTTSDEVAKDLDKLPTDDFLSIVLVGVLGVAGTVCLWLLVGKRLVKKQ